MDAARSTARDLRREAAATDERRLLVLAGDREAGDDAARAACEATGLAAVSLSERAIVAEALDPARSDALLGTTHDCVVVDCHDACRPNAIGRAAGAVDGGGLLVLVTPALDAWPTRRDGFDETLAAPPFDVTAVASVFRRRLVDTLRAHRGVAIVDVDADDVLDDGLTDPVRALPTEPVDPPSSNAFPRAVYEACVTADQRDAVQACERLRDAGVAVVMAADRGRGKSSAAGLAAAAVAASGDDVIVTAPGYRNAAAVFARAADALAALDALADDCRDDAPTHDLVATGDGRIRFRQPPAAADDAADVLVVDEAAALPVRLLESLLEVAPATCFATTVHGYEGSGRGFDVRFREHLEAACDVTDLTLDEPIRYGAADPVEVWLFRALLLDARPAVDPLVTDASPEAATYERLDPGALAADEHRLRQAFGLLVNAHYRTEPNDLARLLDAPNIAVRALSVDGHLVSVALVAREGGLAAETRAAMYEGDRVRGNMLPDVLTSQLRDPDAAVPVGVRVMRIATHHAARSRGFGSTLLAAVEAEVDADGDRPARGPLARDPVDYLGVGYGATPDLLKFWAENGYRTVHLSTTRNDGSGEYSVLMLRPLSPAGREVAERHRAWFRRRIADVLADALQDAAPDVVRAALAATAGTVSIDLTDAEWRVVASAAYGPGLYDVAPRPFRRLALKALLDGVVGNADAERLLVRRVLQARPWGETAEDLGFVSERQCMRALGEAYRPLIDRYGGETARAEADRYR
jgi:tRNA(Met) cytidine acetyltransferase